MVDGIRVARAPCKTCPYRRDVPSGLWAAEEYAKLPCYDGSMLDQLMNGGGAVFDCHQSDGNICAGWLGCHGAHDLVALRLTKQDIAPAVFRFKSPVPLFKSGTQAAEHGMKAIRRPGPRARRAIARLIGKLRGPRNKEK